MDMPAELRQFAEVLTDSYFIVDRDRNIVDFNRAFYAMLPRASARTLKSRKCYEVLKLNICKERCIAQQCWASAAAVRLDEIRGTVEGQDGEMSFILSAIPIRNAQGELIGAMEVQRNVTDESAVQNKYRRQVEVSENRLTELKEKLHQRSRRLLELSREVGRLQQALLKAKTSLFG